jgi:transposase
MRTVAVKTEKQQAALALHQMRSNLVKSRTAQVNQLRGLLYEFGITLKGGRQAGLMQIRERMAELESSCTDHAVGSHQGTVGSDQSVKCRHQENRTTHGFAAQARSSLPGNR